MTQTRLENLNENTNRTASTEPEYVTAQENKPVLQKDNTFANI